MISNQNMYQYTLLAEAAYANFYKNNQLLVSDDDVKAALIAAEMGTNDNPAQADQVINNWSVKAYYVDRGEGDDWKTTQESGFSATLFQGKSGTANAGEYVLAMRGTAGSKDLVIADGTDIVVDGLAMYQLVDMYNFWNQIKAENGEPYLVATLEADEALTDLYQNADALQRLAMRNELSKQGYIIDYLNIGSNDSSAPPSSIFPNLGNPAANKSI